MSESSAPHFRRWLFFSCCGACVFTAWWWMMPKGFPAGHARFWANQVLPPAAALICMTAAWACFKRLPGWTWMLACLPGLGAGILVGCAVLFSSALVNRLVLVPATGFLYLFGTYVWMMRQVEGVWRTWAFCLFAVTGFGWAWSQKAPRPSTRPALSSGLADLNPLPLHHAFEYEKGAARLRLHPLLQFDSMSPDGFWTLFTPGYEPPMPVAHYLLSAGEIDIYTHVPVPVYAHLNTFTEMIFTAEEAITLSFSPCPDERIPVTMSDYPVGRPAKAAYMKEGEFRVVEARSGEKGPYRVLARGPVDEQEPLTITLYSGDQAMFAVTFEDFLRQCSTGLSPTAGWGFPQHAIEFSLVDEDPPAAFIHLSLAGTSMGRGWDSVGHATGLYRNRVSVVIGDE